MSEEFIKELDVIVQKDYEEIVNKITDCDIRVSSFNFHPHMSLKIKKKYGLNKNIGFMVTASAGSGGKTTYLYKGIIVEPDCYYLRPDDYHKVSTLTMLQEAIKQDTHNPDIKHLESGEKVVR